MKKKFISNLKMLAIGIALPASGLAQDLSYQGKITLEMAENEYYNTGEVMKSVMDADKNTYTLIKASSGMELNPGSGLDEFFYNGNNFMTALVKHDENGEFVWGKYWGDDEIAANDGYIVGNDLALLSSGNIMITGYFAGVIDADPGSSEVLMTTSGNIDIFMLILNESGQYLSKVNYGTPGNDYGLQIETDDAGNTYVLQQLALTSQGGNSMRITKFGPTLSSLWTIDVTSTFTSSEIFEPKIALSSTGDVYLGGSFKGAYDFNLNPQDAMTEAVIGSNANTRNVFLVKYNASGQYQWLKTIGHEFDTNKYFGGLTVHEDEPICNFIITTSLGGVDPLLLEAGNANSGIEIESYVEHTIMVKYDASGDYQWHTSRFPDYAGIEYPSYSSVFYFAGSDIEGSLYCYGRTGNIALNATENSQAEPFLAKLNPNDGSISDVLGIRGAGFVHREYENFHFKVYPDGTILSYGVCYLNRDFDMTTDGIDSCGLTDTPNSNQAEVLAFLSIHTQELDPIDPPVSIGENQQNQMLVYPNPANDYFVIQDVEIGATVRITDLSGRLVLQLSADQAELKFSTDEWNNGIYIIEKTQGTAVQKAKLLVSKN